VSQLGDADSEPGPPYHDKRLWRYLLWPVASLLFVLLLILGWIYGVPFGRDSILVPSSASGCLTADGPYIVADVAEVITIDASVRYDRCFSEFLDSSTQVSRDVMVGGRARLMLVSPLFPGSIEPVSQEVQVIDSSGDSGTWAWQVKADKPGTHSLSLVLSILRPDGDDLLVQNPRIELAFHAPETVSYHASNAWRGFTGFLTSLTGLVTAAVAAIVAVLGLRHGKRS